MNIGVTRGMQAASDGKGMKEEGGSYDCYTDPLTPTDDGPRVGDS